MDKNSPSLDKFFSSITPKQSFSSLTSPNAPDYAKQESWAAFPGKNLWLYWNQKWKAKIN